MASNKNAKVTAYGGGGGGGHCLFDPLLNYCPSFRPVGPPFPELARSLMAEG